MSKITVTVLLIVVISEVAKRSTLMGGILASVPLVSVLALIWLYVETRDVQKIVDLSYSVFWLVIPSLALFVVLPVLLKREVNFYISLGMALLVTVISYIIMVTLLNKLGIKL